MAENEKKADYGEEDVASWLERETGHADTPDEGYSSETGVDLPKKRRADLGKFFDGLHIEKEMRERRRQKAVDAMDEAEALNQAIVPRLNEGGTGAPTN